ncbi:MAG: dTDP-4-dehydrorhamnose reductase [Spirochaetota bacterium]
MIWLIGSKGMLGRELSEVLELEGFSFTGTDQEVDITDQRTLGTFASSVKPAITWIVNCSAYTAVDKAEDDKDAAWKVNRDGVRNIAATAASTGAKLIHISTDYVFDGNGNRPYKEDDPVSPIGVYAKSKAAGEKEIHRILSYHYIIRTSWLYGKHGNNFVYTMLRLFKEKESIGIVDDQRGTPTWTFDLAGVIKTIISSSNDAFGTYHYAGEGETTWYRFAVEIHRLAREQGLIQRDCIINPLTTDQYPTKAKRPPYSVFSKEKIKKAFGILIPDWREALARFIGNIESIANRAK